MTPAPIENRTVRVIDHPFGAGRQTLRVALYLDEADTPQDLVLVLGFGGNGEPFTRPAWGDGPLMLPGQAAGPLRDALGKLLEEVEP